MTATRMRRSVDSMSGRLKAILLMCAAVTLFACLDANAKYLGSHFKMPVAEIVWTRFVGQFLLMVALLGPRAVPDLFKTQKFGLQMVRSFLMAATTVCNFVAVQYLRLDQTISIAFLAPLVVALLAGPLLGEYVGWQRALAIVTGFLGILIVIRPGFAQLHPAFAAVVRSDARLRTVYDRHAQTLGLRHAVRDAVLCRCSWVSLAARFSQFRNGSGRATYSNVCCCLRSERSAASATIC